MNDEWDSVGELVGVLPATGLDQDGLDALLASVYGFRFERDGLGRWRAIQRDLANLFGWVAASPSGDGLRIMVYQTEWVRPERWAGVPDTIEHDGDVWIVTKPSGAAGRIVYDKVRTALQEAGALVEDPAPGEQPEIESPPWLPKTKKALLRWRAAHRLIVEMRGEWRDPDGWGTDPAPKLADYADRLKSEMGWRPCAKLVGRVIKAGDAGLLSEYSEHSDSFPSDMVH